MTYASCHLALPKKKRRRWKLLCLCAFLSCLPLTGGYQSRRWEGWDTSTTTVVTYVSADGPQGVLSQTTTTLILTYNPEPPPTRTGGTLTETITSYPGNITPSPSIITTTSTFYPSGVTPPASTTTIIGSSKQSERPKPHNNVCLPGDASYQVPGRSTLTPTPTAKTTLYVIAIFFIVDIVFWNLVGLRTLIYPVKLCVVAYHELGHCVGIVLAGRRISTVVMDPNEGGLIIPPEGIALYPISALPAGFIFSIMIGGALTFCGFNTLAAKIASFFVGISLLMTLWFASGLPSKLLSTGAIALLIGFWFIDHGSVLRYYILFYGVMSSWYIIFDTFDDLVFNKPNVCCCVLHAQRIQRIPAATFAWIYLIMSLVWFILWIFLAVAVFRQSGHAMYCQSQQFLPT